MIIVVSALLEHGLEARKAHFAKIFIDLCVSPFKTDFVAIDVFLVAHKTRVNTPSVWGIEQLSSAQIEWFSSHSVFPWNDVEHTHC